MLFSVSLKHDNGNIKIRTNAKSKEDAISKVLKSENAPISAVRRTTLILSEMSKKECEYYYLDYFNNWQRVESFADYYGLTKREAEKLIEKGKI